MKLAWGKKVSEVFRQRLVVRCTWLGIEPSYLMACMAFETAATFSPSIKNAAGSGAVGLIQFMPQTAFALGTTDDELEAMTQEEQLDYVLAYFNWAKGKLTTLEDVYMTILWPSAIGKPLDYVLFDKANHKRPKRYIQNAGLDFNKDGLITKAEATRRVRSFLEVGLLPENSEDVYAGRKN